MSDTTPTEEVIQLKEEFDKDAIVARYGKDGMTFFTGEFTLLGEGIFSKYPNKE
jgi:hypothetical protein